MNIFLRINRKTIAYLIIYYNIFLRQKLETLRNYSLECHEIIILIIYYNLYKEYINN